MAIIVPAIAGKIIHIGRAGENLATTVEFDVSEWLEEFGSNGTFTLFVQQTGGEYYVQEIVQPGNEEGQKENIVQWNVGLPNTVTVGLGKCMLSYSQQTDQQKPVINGYANEENNVIVFYEDSNHETKIENPNSYYLYFDLTNNNDYYYFNGVQFNKVTDQSSDYFAYQTVKSIIYDIVVTNSLDIEAQGNIPTPIESWLTEVSQMADAISNAAEYAETAEAAATTATEQAGRAETAATGAAGSATTSQGWATGGTTGTPSLTNNSKYFAQQAERWAKGTQDGVAVEGGNGYHDNSKYYSERIQSLEVDTVTTGAPGTNASASVSLDTSTNKLSLNLTIPRGDTGHGLEVSGEVISTSYLPTASEHQNEIYIVGSNPGNYYYSILHPSTNQWIWVNGGPIGGLSATLYDWTSNS